MRLVLKDPKSDPSIQIRCELNAEGVDIIASLGEHSLVLARFMHEGSLYLPTLSKDPSHPVAMHFRRAEKDHILAYNVESLLQ